MQRTVAIWVCAHALWACSAEPLVEPFVPQCNVNQFRACQTEDCRGAQQCVEPGHWDRCFCTVLDASVVTKPDASADAAGDSTLD